MATGRMSEKGSGRRTAIALVWVGAVAATGCAPNDSKLDDRSGPTHSALVFSCDKLPGVSGLRLCYATDKYCGKEGGCFKRSKAYCYIRSAIGDGAWSTTDKTVSCFPTPDECTKDHDGVGSWGPPPLQTECREMSPDEQPI